jgi:hypothetical protein
MTFVVADYFDIEPVNRIKEFYKVTILADKRN